MEQEFGQFLKRCLLVDIEISEKNVVYSLGALLGEKTFRSPGGHAVSQQVLEELAEFGHEAEFLLDHNIPALFLTGSSVSRISGPQPATPEGKSLQGEVVAAILCRNDPCPCPPAVVQDNRSN